MKRIIYLTLSLLLLSSSTILAQNTNSAKISAKITDYDFGVIKETNGKVSYTFVIDNVGSKPLVITRVISACGCTTPEFSQEPVPEGKSTDIKVTYDPTGRPGPFVKTIAIYSNGKDGAFTVRIKGIVE